MTKSVNPTLVRFVRLAEKRFLETFLLKCLRVLEDDRRLVQKSGAIKPKADKVKGKVLGRGLLRITASCKADPVFLIMEFACFEMADW